MEETRGKYDSIQQMMDSMPCELEVKTWESGFSGYYVLQSKNNDELQRHVPADHSIPITRFPTAGITLQDFLVSGIYMIKYLVQIWARVSIGDKKYLTTSDQPFVLGKLDRGLCSYRKHCLNYLIPIDDDDMMSSEGGRVLLGPPGRVFREGLPEMCDNIRRYTPIEYPLRDKALESGICFYLALPFSKSSEYRYGCVAEVVSLKGFVPGYGEIHKRICDLNREKFTAGCPVPQNFNISDNLRAIGKAHDLLLAQTWFSASQYNNAAVGTPSAYISWNMKNSYNLRTFNEDSYYIKKGRGVVGKAFSSKGACFCKDVTQLSIDEYSMLPNARGARLTGCFAISLTHRHNWKDYIFIVEFFLPHKETEYGDARTLIKNLVTTMKEHLKGFRVASGQELGENLLVEVIKTSLTDELDSFEIGAGADNTFVLSGEIQVALDQEILTNMFLGTGNLNQIIHNPKDLQHGGEVVGIVDARTEADQRDINSEILKNERAKKQIQRDYGVMRVELLQHSLEKQEDAAAHFGDSRSTFKRICKEHQNFKWQPRSEKHHGGPSNGTQGLVSSAEEIIKDSFLELLPGPVQPRIKTSPTDELDSLEIDVRVDTTLVLWGGARTLLDREKEANVPLDGSDGSNQNELELLHHAGQSSSIGSNPWSQGTIIEHQSSWFQGTIMEGQSSRVSAKRVWKRLESSSTGNRETIISRFKESLEEIRIDDANGRLEMPNPPNVVNVASNPSENPVGLQHGGAVVHFGNIINNMENADNAEQDSIKNYCMKELPVVVQPVKQYLNSKPDSTENATRIQNDSSITVKVEYGGHMIRFDLALPSGKMALEEEIEKRFHLSIGTFNVEYLDEDKDWILVACDADLKTCVTLMKSTGNDRINMRVKSSQDN